MKVYFKEQYNLNALSWTSQEIGFNNLSNIIISDQGKFFQTIYQRLSFEEIKKIIFVMDYLVESGFPVPQPIKNIFGGYVTDFQSKPSVLFSFLLGEIKNQFSVKELSNIGKTLAKLHLSLRLYPTIEDFIQEGKDYNSTGWYDNNIVSLKQLNSLESKLLLEEYTGLRKSWPQNLDLNKLPLSLLHWDFRNENILFQDEKISGITDFECLQYDNRIYDILFAVIGFCMLQKKLDKEGMISLLGGYKSVTPLEKSELDAFPFMLKLMTWDKWCSIYISSEVGLSNKRKARIKYNHYKENYLNIKGDKILN